MSSPKESGAPDATKPVPEKEVVKTSKNQKKVEEEELTEEDQQLKQELEMLVERLTESDLKLYNSALTNLKNFIKDSTSSMTAVPKPLKFLRPHYPALVALYEKWEDAQLKYKLADILSVLGMTYSDEGNRDSLSYRLKSSDTIDLAEWGHEYVRHLALEIGEEYQYNLDNEVSNDELLKLSLKIVPLFLKHNAEADAVDLLLEVEAIDKLIDFVDKDTFARVCLYMVSCVPLLAPPDDVAFLHTAFSIYLSQNQLPQALALAIRLDDEELIKNVFNATNDIHIQKQLGFILGRQNSSFKFDQDPEVQECINNVKKAKYFQYLGKELNLMDPKLPEDIYKSHLENNTWGGVYDSAKQNLASSFVNGFVNMGFGVDKFIDPEDDSKSWIYKTKDNGMLSTTASIGLIHAWDIDEGLQKLDKYLYAPETEIKSGALLGMGVSSSSVHDEVEAALVILQDYLSDPDVSKELVSSAISGVGIGFAGSKNEEVLNLLLPIVSDSEQPIELNALAALALGHVFVGTCNGDITSTILQTLLERDSVELSNRWARFLSLGLGLLYMGNYEQVGDVLETIEAIEHPIANTLKVLVTICAYAGTGNVLQIQSLLQMCSTKPEDSDEDEEDEEGGAENEPGALPQEGVTSTAPDSENTEDALDQSKEEPKEEDKSNAEPETTPEDKSFQGYAVLGLATICMGEEIGQDMVLRHFGHLMHYGNPLIKRAVPLAMGLVCASNAQMKVFDTLSRYSHDQDIEVAINAVFSMGIVGAGTNNARLAQLLRQLASYYSKEKDALFAVRIAQGLIHLGKGTLSLSPYNTERQILSRVSLAGLLTVAVSMLDPKAFILEDQHSLLYYLTPSIYPRSLITVDEDLEPIKVNVRVGQAIDVVGQAGKPKTITGWVTHSTPVLLGYGEKAELEDDKYLSLASALEGVVILRKNPDYVEEE